MKRFLTLTANLLVVFVLLSVQVNFALMFVDYQKVGLMVIILFMAVAIGYVYKELNEL